MAAPSVSRKLNSNQVKIKIYDASATPAYRDMPGLQGPHDGALRALYCVLPDTPVEDMIASFNNCCQRWPYAGVSNKEFNVALVVADGCKRTTIRP